MVQQEYQYDCSKGYFRYQTLSQVFWVINTRWERGQRCEEFVDFQLEIQGKTSPLKRLGYLVTYDIIAYLHISSYFCILECVPCSQYRSNNF